MLNLSSASTHSSLGLNIELGPAVVGCVSFSCSPSSHGYGFNPNEKVVPCQGRFSVQRKYRRRYACLSSVLWRQSCAVRLVLKTKKSWMDWTRDRVKFRKLVVCEFLTKQSRAKRESGFVQPNGGASRELLVVFGQ